MSLDKFIERAESTEKNMLGRSGNPVPDVQFVFMHWHKVTTALKEAADLMKHTHTHFGEDACCYCEWLEKWDAEFKDE